MGKGEDAYKKVLAQDAKLTKKQQKVLKLAKPILAWTKTMGAAKSHDIFMHYSDAINNQLRLIREVNMESEYKILLYNLDILEKCIGNIKLDPDLHADSKLFLKLEKAAIDYRKKQKDRQSGKGWGI